jgi:hypothetical protein
MLSIKETKNGGVAIIFGKNFVEFAKNVYPVLSARLLGGEKTLEMTEKQKTLADVQKSVEGKGVTIRLNEAKVSIPKTLSKQELHDEISSTAMTIENLGVYRRKLWSIVYEELKQRTDIKQSDLKNMKGSAKFSDCRSVSKYRTLIDLGYGFTILQILKEIYNAHK